MKASLLKEEFKTNKYGTSRDRKNRLAALSLYSLWESYDRAGRSR